MATQAQITANRNNAQASTGPVTAAGRARVSRNAVSHGLYSSGDFVRPDEQDIYSQFCAGFQADLMPNGAIEQTLSAEIIHAAWRLRRCSVTEAGMSPIEDHQLDPLLDKTQQAIDRARAAAHRILHRTMSELRRLQTERRLSKAEEPDSAIQSRSSSPQPVSIGRNSPCTCGSGVKFKHCCGKGAPAVLNLAA
jgi:uncharacterized protein YecA (UPF0149 family)